MKKSLSLAFGAALLLLVALSGIASAHTPKVALNCEGAFVDLTSYNTYGDGKNSVVVTLDGDVVDSDDDFGASYSWSDTDLNPYLGHTLKVVVKAWDDPEGTKGYSVTVEKSIDPCKEHKAPKVSAHGCDTIDGKGTFTIEGLEKDVVLVLNDKVYDGDGTFDLAPGSYEWVAYFGERKVGDGEFTVGDCPRLPDAPKLTFSDCTTVAGQGGVKVEGIEDGVVVNIVNPDTGFKLTIDEDGSYDIPEGGPYGYRVIYVPGPALAQVKPILLDSGTFTIGDCPRPNKVEAFAVPCPADIPAGTTVPSRVRIVAAILLGLQVRIDGLDVELDENGEVNVTPGLRHVEVLSTDGETVLFDGIVDCPTCSAASVPTPTPTHTLPPTDTVLGTTGSDNGTGGLMALVVLLMLASGGILVGTRVTNKRD